MRISDWSSDVCSSDLVIDRHRPVEVSERQRSRHLAPRCDVDALCGAAEVLDMRDPSRTDEERTLGLGGEAWLILVDQHRVELRHRSRSEEHTSELQSLLRISYAVFCLKTNK